MDKVDPELYLSQIDRMLRHKGDYKTSLTSPAVKDALLSQKKGGGINDFYLTHKNLDIFNNNLLNFIDYVAQENKKPHHIYARYSRSQHDMDGAKSINYTDIAPEYYTPEEMAKFPREAGLSVIDIPKEKNLSNFLSDVGKYGMIFGNDHPDAEYDRTLNILTGDKINGILGGDGEPLLGDNIETLRRFPVSIGNNVFYANNKSDRYNKLLQTLNSTIDLIRSHKIIRNAVIGAPSESPLTNNPNETIKSLLQIKKGNRNG